MGGVEPRRRVDEHTEAEPDATKRVRLELVEQVLEREPIDVLHDEVIPARDLANIDDGDRVRVMKMRREARLIEEHRDELRLLGQVRVEDLDGEQPLEAASAGEPREIDGAHPPSGDLGDELVAAESNRGTSSIKESGPSASG